MNWDYTFHNVDKKSASVIGECHRKRKSTPQKHEINAHHKQICVCPTCKPSNRCAIGGVGESSLNIVFCMGEFEISQPLQVRVHLFLNFYLSLQQSIFCLLSPIFVQQAHLSYSFPILPKWERKCKKQKPNQKLEATIFWEISAVKNYDKVSSGMFDGGVGKTFSKIFWVRNKLKY